MRFDRVAIFEDPQTKLKRYREQVAKTAVTNVLKGKQPAPLIRRRHSTLSTDRLLRIPKRYKEKLLDPIPTGTANEEQLSAGGAGVSLEHISTADPEVLRLVVTENDGQLTYADLFVIMSFLAGHPKIGALSVVEEREGVQHLTCKIPRTAVQGFNKMLLNFRNITRIIGLELLVDPQSAADEQNALPPLRTTQLEEGATYLCHTKALVRENLIQFRSDQRREMSTQIKHTYNTWLFQRTEERRGLVAEEERGRWCIAGEEGEVFTRIRRGARTGLREIQRQRMAAEQSQVFLGMRVELERQETRSRDRILAEVLIRRPLSLSLQAELLHRLYIKDREVSNRNTLIYNCKRSWGDSKSHEVHRMRRDKVERKELWDHTLVSRITIETLYTQDLSAIEQLSVLSWQHILGIEEDRVVFYEDESSARSLLEQAETMAFDSFLDTRREINKRIEREAQNVLERFIKAEGRGRVAINESRGKDFAVFLELQGLSNHVASVSVRLTGLSKAAHNVRSTPPHAVFVDTSDSMRHYLPGNGHVTTTHLFPATKFCLSLDELWNNEYALVRKEEEFVRHLVNGAFSLVGREMDNLAAKHEWIRTNNAYKSPLPSLRKQFDEYKWLVKREVLRQTKLTITSFTIVVQSMCLNDYRKKEIGLNRSVEALVESGKIHRNRLAPNRFTDAYRRTLNMTQDAEDDALSPRNILAPECTTESEACPGNTGGASNVFLAQQHLDDVQEESTDATDGEQPLLVVTSAPGRKRLEDAKDELRCSTVPKTLQKDRLLERLFYKGDEVQYNARHSGWVIHISGYAPSSVLGDIHYQCLNTETEVPNFETQRYRILKTTISAEAGESNAFACLPKTVLLSPPRLRLLEKRGVPFHFGSGSCELFRSTFLNMTISTKNDNTLWDSLLEGNKHDPRAPAAKAPPPVHSPTSPTTDAPFGTAVTMMKTRKKLQQRHKEYMHFVAEMTSSPTEGLIFKPTSGMTVQDNGMRCTPSPPPPTYRLHHSERYCRRLFERRPHGVGVEGCGGCDGAYRRA